LATAIAASLALMHAAAEEVRTGELSARTAPNTLSLTIPDLLRRREN
jgi:hypothetical protein